MFKKYVSKTLITNCAVTTDIINRAELIYGPSVPVLEDHMVRHKLLIHNKIKKIPLPPMVAAHHLTIVQVMDLFFVNEKKSSTLSPRNLISDRAILCI